VRIVELGSPSDKAILTSLSSAAILFIAPTEPTGRSLSSIIREIRQHQPGLHISVCSAPGVLCDEPNAGTISVAE
jgi:hypothetical protein